MSTIISTIIFTFLISFGVVFGTGIFAGLASLITDKPPIKTMVELADWVKVWAIAIALGGSFNSFEIIEKGILKGEVRVLVKQAVCILAAMLGANIGCRVINLSQKCGELWHK